MLTAETGQHRKGGEVHQRSPRHGHSRCCRRMSIESCFISLRWAITSASDWPAIKNVGENTAKGICEARGKRGKFRTLYRFLRSHRSRLVESSRVLESLIKSGALDCLGDRARGTLGAIEEAMKHGQRAAHEQDRSGQSVLFLRDDAASSVALRSLTFPEAWTNGPKNNVWPANTPCSAFTFPAIRWINSQAG